MIIILYPSFLFPSSSCWQRFVEHPICDEVPLEWEQNTLLSFPFLFFWFVWFYFVCLFFFFLFYSFIFCVFAEIRVALWQSDMFSVVVWWREKLVGRFMPDRWHYQMDLWGRVTHNAVAWLRRRDLLTRTRVLITRYWIFNCWKQIYPLWIHFDRGLFLGLPSDWISSLDFA